MKLKDIGFPHGRFDFFSANVTGTSINIIGEHADNDRRINILVDEIIHFRITDESYSIDTFLSLIAKDEDKELFDKQCFFEIIDSSYSDWVLKESYFPLDECFKQYFFIFREDLIEIISSSPPIFSFIE